MKKLICLLVLLLSIPLVCFVQVAMAKDSPVKVTIEPVDAKMEEYGVYIFYKKEPFKIKVTLENISKKELNLLTPGMQNHYQKVFYFQVLDEEGSVIETDTRDVVMTHSETLGPERIKLKPNETHVFYAYINSNKGGIEHHHFAFRVLDNPFTSRYHKIRGIYDTTGYREMRHYYRDTDEVTVTSNEIMTEVVEKNTDLPPNLSFLSDVPEFQEFRFHMSGQEIKEIAQKNSLILEGNSQDGFMVTNKDGVVVALPMFKGRCSGIQRLPRLAKQPLQLTIKSDKEVYGVGDGINIVLKIKNNSENKIEFEAVSSFRLRPGWLWGPVRLDKEGDGREITTTSPLSLEPFDEKTLKYNLYEVKWDKEFSSVWPIRPLDSLISPGKYNLHLSIEIRDRTKTKLTSNTIQIEVVEKEVEASNFTLYVSNQSLTINNVDIKVYIDGKIVINEDFDVTGKRVPQHNWKKFEFNLEKGKHKIKVESNKGKATLEKEFEIKDEHWAVVDYWFAPELPPKHATKHFTFNIQDSPIGFE